MDHASRPLTKRPRASLACNACRQNKSKCDGGCPSCERCAKSGSDCVYTQGGRDKRMERQDERRANMALVGRVKELEARLAALSAQSSPASTARDTPALAPPPDDAASAASATEAVNGPVETTTADAIATGLFDHPPVVDIGYFGSSSNHAFFWSLSASIETISRRSTMRHPEPAASRAAPPVDPLPGVPDNPQLTGAGAGPSATTTTSSTTSPAPKPAQHDDGFPGARLAVDWSLHYFETVGAVLPYVAESDVLRCVDTIAATRQGWDAVGRPKQALLSILFAQALHTMDGERSPEPFYRRTLRLLDEKTVYHPTVEALQALLLLASFQQNTQRSMESWAPHYRAVRVSYQLGIHAPASYEQLPPQEQEIRSCLWMAVVNQDRIMTAGLARPCLIPLQHVRMQLLDHLDPLRQAHAAGMSRPSDSLVYYRRLIGLHEILGIIVDSIYGANINSFTRLALGDLVAKTVDISWKLDQWRDSAVRPGLVSADTDFDTWTLANHEAERYPVLLSIFNYRAMMLLHGSLLMRVLERVTNAGEDASAGALQDAALSLLRNYLTSLRGWLRLINGILRHGRSPLNCNAVWWTSNYMMLSTCIHIFSFWLLSLRLKSSVAVLGVHANDIETLLRGSLDTMQLLGGTSIMIHKAHRCLMRYMQLLNSMRPLTGSTSSSEALVEAAPPLLGSALVRAPGTTGFETDQSLPATGSMGIQWTPTMSVGESMPVTTGNNVIASCLDDMFGSLDPIDFMKTDFMGFGQSVSDFDACGFI